MEPAPGVSHIECLWLRGQAHSVCGHAATSLCGGCRKRLVEIEIGC